MYRFAIALVVALAVGQQAPDLTLPDENGKAISLSASRGHKVVLVFYRGYW
jgi:peroxiredoxin